MKTKALSLLLTFVFITFAAFSQSGESKYKSLNLSKDPKKTRGSADPLSGLNVALEEQEMLIGDYYALIIGIDKYSGAWEPLNNAVREHHEQITEMHGERSGKCNVEFLDDP